MRELHPINVFIIYSIIMFLANQGMLFIFKEFNGGRYFWEKDMDERILFFLIACIYLLIILPAILVDRIVELFGLDSDTILYKYNQLMFYGYNKASRANR